MDSYTPYYFQVGYVLNRYYVSTLKEWDYYYLLYLFNYTSTYISSTKQLISCNKRDVTHDFKSNWDELQTDFYLL